MAERNTGNKRQLLVGITHDLSRRVWSLDGFPTELVPEVDTFVAGIEVSQPNMFGTFQIHPGIVEPLKSELQASLDRNNGIKENMTTAFHNPVNGQTSFAEPMASFAPENVMQRVVAHEAITAHISQERVKTPDRYTQYERNYINEVLPTLFPKGDISLEDTTISQRHFRRVLFADGFVIVDILPPGINTADEMLALEEILPTMFEIVTEQLANRYPTITDFNQALRTGEVKPLQYQEHPLFFRTFINACVKLMDHDTDYDWRDILRDFTTSNLQLVREKFEQMFGPSGQQELDALISSMLKDEANLRLL